MTNLWQMVHGDCIEVMDALPPASFDFAVFSVPFPALFSYTSEPGDLGNSEGLDTEAPLHFSFFYHALRRVMKPGRVVVAHVMQIPRMKRAGGVGLCDFRGLNIRVAERARLIYEYDWAVRKNPQAQAIRTRSRELQFVGLENDRAKSRGTLLDYLIKFTAPGENAVPVNSRDDVSRNQWIEWAEGCWRDIKETDTLNIRGTKGDDDTRHICPLQLGVIERLIRLYTNPGELVFSPFAGIGSEGYEAVRRGRRFYGVELKEEYYLEAKRNLARAEQLANESQRTLFDLAIEATSENEHPDQ